VGCTAVDDGLAYVRTARCCVGTVCAASLTARDPTCFALHHAEFVPRGAVQGNPSRTVRSMSALRVQCTADTRQ
jgi:hypothetical protein